jgi:hypothetical protein
MSKQRIYIVTDVDLGWDNIVFATTKEEEAEKCKDSRGDKTNVVHTIYLSDKYEK